MQCRTTRSTLAILSFLTSIAVNAGETNAQETNPGETAGQETNPSETAPSETAPSETAPNETAPNETAPNETAPNVAKPSSNEANPSEPVPSVAKPNSKETKTNVANPKETKADVANPKETKERKASKWKANDIGFRIVDDQVNLNFKADSVTMERAVELEGTELYWEGSAGRFEWGLYLSTAEANVGGNDVSVEYFDARVGISFLNLGNFSTLVGFNATDYEIILKGAIDDEESLIQVNSLTDHAAQGFVAAKYDNGRIQVRTELDTAGHGSAEAKLDLYWGFFLEAGYKFDTLQEDATPIGTFGIERERAFMGAGWSPNVLFQ